MSSIQESYASSEGDREDELIHSDEGSDDISDDGSGPPLGVTYYIDDDENENIRDVTSHPERATSVLIDYTLWEKEWREMCDLVRRSNRLRKIELRAIERNDELMFERLSEMFGANENYSCPLHSIRFQIRKKLFRRHIEVVTNFMKSRLDTLWTLHLIPIRLADGCVRVISDAMDDGLRLEELIISCSDLPPAISDDEIEKLLSSENARYLKRLEIISSTAITRSGFDSVARFLQRTHTNIEKLHVCLSSMDMEAARMLLCSIPANTTLRIFALSRLGSSSVESSSNSKYTFESAAKILQDLVCNLSDFGSLCRSNNTLYDVGYNTYHLKVNRILRQALEINERHGCSPNQRLRTKLRDFYFKGAFDVQPFIHMDIEYMPNVLELVTMSEECIAEEKEGRMEEGTHVIARNGHLGSIYRLIRNCHLPELFGYPSQESKVELLEGDNTMLKSEVERLRAENASLQSQLEGSTASMQRLEEEIAMLKNQIECSQTPRKRLKSSEN